jgi:hypothetical protein
MNICNVYKKKIIQSNISNSFESLKKINRLNL